VLEPAPSLVRPETHDVALLRVVSHPLNLAEARLIARDPANRPDSVAWERAHLNPAAPPQYTE